jgi:hypothetical protein
MLHVGRSIECIWWLVNRTRESMMYCIVFEDLVVVVMTSSIPRNITPIELTKRHYITEDGTFLGDKLFLWAEVLSFKYLMNDFRPTGNCPSSRNTFSAFETICSPLSSGQW